MICNEFFSPGELTIMMDGPSGSTGKAKAFSYIAANSDNWQFCCNTFAPQAGHTIKLQDGRMFFYQTLNSCAYMHEKFEKMYLGPGATIELPSLLREIEENNIPRNKIGISPIVPILDKKIDAGFESGDIGFDGEHKSTRHEGTSKFGSTAHGCGSVAARRVLRRPSLVLAKDVPELREMICDVPIEITQRLDRGQAGLLELAQGFQLSLLHQDFFPFVTSRNVTVSQALSDMFLPPVYAGQVILNFRTFPIRINNNKYIADEDGRHLTWDEVEAGVPHTVYKGNSGHWYPDQEELTWDEVTEFGGSPEKIMEITSVTKLPRRVATFSKQNFLEAFKFNDTGKNMWASINFANYVDYEMTGSTSQDLSYKFKLWLNENLGADQDRVRFVGTGPCTEDMIFFEH